MKPWPALLLILLLAGHVAAQFGTETFNEDFESFDLFVPFGDPPDPDQAWYNYRDLQGIGNITDEAPIIEGNQSFRVVSPAGTSISNKVVDFDLEVPIALDTMTFFLNTTTITDNGNGSNQFISVQSSAPRRDIVQFYILCDDADSPDGCSFNVRFEHVDTQGQVLIAASNNQSEFKVHMDYNWFNGTYHLFVDDVDDGHFPFLELPDNIGRLRIGQADAATGISTTFDNWTITGASSEAPEVVVGDAATGIKNFLDDIRFTTTGSLLIMGLVMFVALLAAVMVPMFSLGKDNTLTPALTFYAVLVALWLITMEIWPDWIGIALIIATSAVVSLLVRKGLLGIRDASTGPGLIAGSMGYFIIASTFLAFSGYAGESVFLPTEDLGIDEAANNELADNDTVEQSFFGAAADCTIGIISFGKLGNCDRKEEGKAIKWAKSTIDSIGRVTSMIFGYARAAVGFLFQLLTFQLPIPVVFNMMIVLPPAAALATYAIEVIRGK